MQHSSILSTFLISRRFQICNWYCLNFEYFGWGYSGLWVFWGGTTIKKIAQDNYR